MIKKEYYIFKKFIAIKILFLLVYVNCNLKTPYITKYEKLKEEELGFKTSLQQQAQ